MCVCASFIFRFFRAGKHDGRVRMILCLFSGFFVHSVLCVARLFGVLLSRLLCNLVCLRFISWCEHILFWFVGITGAIAFRYFVRLIGRNSLCVCAARFVFRLLSILFVHRLHESCFHSRGFGVCVCAAAPM